MLVSVSHPEGPVNQIWVHIPGVQYVLSFLALAICFLLFAYMRMHPYQNSLSSRLPFDFSKQLASRDIFLSPSPSPYLNLLTF